MISHYNKFSWTEPLIISLAILLPGLISVPTTVNSIETNHWLINGSVQSMSQFILLYLIIGKKNKLSEYGVKLFQVKDITRAILLAGLLLIVSVGTISLIDNLITMSEQFGFSLPSKAANEYIPKAQNSSTVIFHALSVLFSFSIAYKEELFYRLYLLGSLAERGAPKSIALFLSSIIFAIGHIYQGAGGFASALLSGIICALAVQYGYGLHALALGHGLYNYIVLATQRN